MLGIYRVSGVSMSPVLDPGDFVIIIRRYCKFNRGDLVVVDHPRYHLMIKRILSVSATGLWLCGEHDSSLSTQQMGRVDFSWVKGKVLLKVKNNSRTSVSF